MNMESLIARVVTVFIICVAIGSIQECHYEHEEKMRCLEKTGSTDCHRIREESKDVQTR